MSDLTAAASLPSGADQGGVESPSLGLGLGALETLTTPVAAAVRRWPSPMRDEAFHGPLGELVRAVTPHTEADPAAILAHAIGYAGSILGSKPHFRVESTKHPLNEFVLVIGPTATGRKGTARDVVHQVFAPIDPSWAANCTAPSLSSGEGLIYAIRDPSMGGGVDSSDRGVEDKRLLVIDSEFASTLRVLRRDANTLSPFLRNAWDGSPLRTLTKNNPVRVKEPHVSIVGHITEEEIVAGLDRIDAANGFANRFLWLVSRRSNCFPDGASPPAEATAGIREKLAVRIRDGAEFTQFVRDGDARSRWHSVYEGLTADRPGLLGGLLARGAAHVCRLSALYALFDGTITIGRVHLEAALAFWDYCERSVRYVFGDVLGDPIADDILTELSQRPDGMTRTEIRDFLGKHEKGSDISRALRYLGAAQLATCEYLETGGRKAERWRLKLPAANGSSIPSVASVA